MAVRAMQAPIRLWHRFGAPLFPPMCRFHPSCSVYAIEALESHRVPRALWLIAGRLTRCQPFHPGGFDPVPGREGAADGTIDGDETQELNSAVSAPPHG